MFAQMGEFLNLISVKLSWSPARVLESKVTCIHKNREEERAACISEMLEMMGT